MADVRRFLDRVWAVRGWAEVVGRRLGYLSAAAAVTVLMTADRPVQAASLVVISVAGNNRTICDTDDPGDCLTVDEHDLILCRPTSTGVDGEITGCDWSMLLQGSDTGGDPEEIDKQVRAIEIAPNGTLAFVLAGSDFVQGLSSPIRSDDIWVFTHPDPLRPYLGGAPYNTGSGDGGIFDIYLDGRLSQDENIDAKPWDALELIAEGDCQDRINANGTNGPHNCPIIGSLSSGNTNVSKFGGIKFGNEDLIRCVPTGFAGDGTVDNCDYSTVFDASGLKIGGVPNPINSDVEAVDVLEFDPQTMAVKMVFQKKSGNLPSLPHEPGRDLLVYEGGLGSGLCDVSATRCAADSDCPFEVCAAGTCSVSLTACTDDSDCPREACDTGSCTVTTGQECATKQDCPTGEDCNYTIADAYDASVKLFFDGSAVGLSGSGDNIEGFSVVPDLDGDIIPDGLDNCPDLDNPPSVCNDPSSTACPSGLSTECPPGYVCTQPDSDGDGVGDACDLCDGRPDTGPNACECGDGIVDVPSPEAQGNGLINEQCDLGAANDPAGPCTDDCKILGVCTGTSAATCSVDMPCPPGESCCGDAVPEPPEECDDGNTIEDDACNSSCQAVVGGVEIEGCDGLTGPNIVPAFVKITKFKNTSKFPDIDRWKTKGDFNLPDGVLLDPTLNLAALNQSVKITYNNTLSGIILEHTLPPGNFDLKVNKPTVTKYLFKDKEANVPGAGSWRKGKFIQKANKVKYVLDGRVTTENALGTLFPLGALDDPPVVRQTIRVGDICATLLMSPPICEIKGNGKTVKCKP